jgi:TRAP-type C4-dicarboxylate transport system substrate-binding protein
MTRLYRRTLLAGAALPLFAINTRPARAAEFSLKLANNSPVTHPQTVRQQQAAERIKAATNGQVDIQVFPNNQLGSDTDMLSQLRRSRWTRCGIMAFDRSPVRLIRSGCRRT